MLPANDLDETDVNRLNASMITNTIKGVASTDTNETTQLVTFFFQY